MTQRAFSIPVAAPIAVVCLLGALVLPATAQASTADAVMTDADRSAPIPDGNGIALFKVTHPEGGTWDYGTRGFILIDNYSEYYHPTRRHATSVNNGNGDYNSSRPAKKKTWAKTSNHHTFVGNRANYRFVG